MNISDEYNSTALHSSTAKERCSPAVESIVTREKSGIGSSPSLANRLTNHGYACWLLACHNARSCTLGQERESVIPTPCYHSRHSFGRITATASSRRRDGNTRSTAIDTLETRLIDYLVSPLVSRGR